jgi:P27 family predicted phage terminase small subunit
MRHRCPVRPLHRATFAISEAIRRNVRSATSRGRHDAPRCRRRRNILSGYARDEWIRIAGELQCIGLLTAIDETMFAVYCSAYSHWRTAGEVFARFAADAPEREVLARIERDAGRSMLAAAKQFGMTALSRSRLGIG